MTKLVGFKEWAGDDFLKTNEENSQLAWEAATERCLRALDRVNGRSQGVYTQLRDIRKLIEEDENL